MSTNPTDPTISAKTQADLVSCVQRLNPGWPLQAEDFQYLEGGYSNANYRFCYLGKHFVLRVPLSSAPEELPAAPHNNADSANKTDNANNLAVEIQFRAQLKPQAQLAIAPLIAADVTAGEMITGYVEGPLLAEQLPGADQVITYLRHLHEQLAAVPQSDHYDLDQLVKHWLPRPPTWLSGYLTDTTDRQLLTHGDLQCCHNDLNPWNIIQSSHQPNQWTTLDWETAKRSHPVFDAVTLHQGIMATQLDHNAIGTGVALNVATQTWPSLSEFCTLALSNPVSSQLLTAALRSYWLREYAWAAAKLRRGSQNPALTVQLRLAQEQLQIHLDL